MTLCDGFTEPKQNLNQTVKFEPNLENRVRGFPALPLKLVKLECVRWLLRQLQTVLAGSQADMSRGNHAAAGA